MANSYINIYKNNPTENGTDGTALSCDGAYTSQLSVELIASQSETKVVKLAIRAEDGFKTTSDTIISDSGDTNDRWKFSLTENGNFADSITISDKITNKNKIFYAKASSAVTEVPETDRDVSLKVTTIIGPSGDT